MRLQSSTSGACDMPVRCQSRNCSCCFDLADRVRGVSSRHTGVDRAFRTGFVVGAVAGAAFQCARQQRRRLEILQMDVARVYPLSRVSDDNVHKGRRPATVGVGIGWNRFDGIADRTFGCLRCEPIVIMDVATVFHVAQAILKRSKLRRSREIVQIEWTLTKCQLLSHCEQRRDANARSEQECLLRRIGQLKIVTRRPYEQCVAFKNVSMNSGRSEERSAIFLDAQYVDIPVCRTVAERILTNDALSIFGLRDVHVNVRACRECGELGSSLSD